MGKLHQQFEPISEFQDLASKKDDPAYSQLSGHVPKEIARQFRIVCADEELKISEGLEQAIKCWLEIKKKEAQEKSLE